MPWWRNSKKNKDTFKVWSQNAIKSILDKAKEIASNLNNSKLDQIQIARFVENIDKVNLARQYEIYNLFGPSEIEELIQLEEEANSTFQNKIMEFLNSITIDTLAFKFREAEEKIKDIQDLNKNLPGKLILWKSKMLERRLMIYD